jgi:hypothetical protein
LALPATFKLARARSRLSFSATHLEATGDVEIENKASASTTALSISTNSANLVGLASSFTGQKFDLAASVGVANVSAATEFIGSRFLVGGDFLVSSNEATNTITSNASVFSNAGGFNASGAGGAEGASAGSSALNQLAQAQAPSGDRSGLAVSVAVGETVSTISLDDQSRIDSGGVTSLITKAKPTQEGSANLNIWGDGKLSIIAGVNVDNTTSTVTVDGDINAGNPLLKTSYKAPGSVDKPKANPVVRADFSVSSDGGGQVLG